ncbi:MAG TPA: hypothetical protein DEP51_05790 [Clostridiales bacterium]|nr:hypothetical protein [Clostridiales bacterium]
MNIKFLKDINTHDLVGGKGLNLAKMYQNGFNIPNGFVITSDVFIDFLKQNNVRNTINDLIKNCNAKIQNELDETSKKIIEILDKCKMSKLIENKIIENFETLNCKYVAVRSSATSEDGKENAWAGTLESFLNVDKNDIIQSVRKCWYSIFKSRALFYRIANCDYSDIAVAVVVQKMVQSDISGVAFSINPTNDDNNEIVIEAVFGLGEAIVSGKVTPDMYILNKNNNKIKDKIIKQQKSKLVKECNKNKWILVKNEKKQKLSDNKIIELSNTIKKIEEFYGFPVDVEWGIQDNKIYILQSRPVTKRIDNSILNTIIKKGDWQFYVARKYNWFVNNTEIYASQKEYQEKFLGFELSTQNYLCINGDEYSLDSDFHIFCDKLDIYFENDINFFENFAKIEFELVEKIKKYLKYIKNKNFEYLNTKEISKEFENFNEIYINSCIPGMTRPDDYLIYKLKEELKNSKFDKNDINNIFLKISTCPNYFPLFYSEEPLDLLKIAQYAKQGNSISKLIDEHIQKYGWMKGPLKFEETFFIKEDYLKRIDNLLDANIEDKIENIKNVRESNDIEYENILQNFKFSEKEKKLIKAIRDFIFLRTYITEYSNYLFFEARNTIFNAISKKVNIAVCDLIMLNDKEILNVLNNNTIMNKTINDRKEGFAKIWLDGNIKTLFGSECLNLQNEIENNFKNIIDEDRKLNKDVISGSIANKGKVRGVARILKLYSDIYKVNKGDILVATMTTPDYVSAMEKAAGFITDEGGITCHAAILSREFNVPCIVGTVNATEQIKDGEIIELDAYKGKVYKLD